LCDPREIREQQSRVLLSRNELTQGFGNHGGLRRRLGRPRRHSFEREHWTVAQHAHLQSLAVLRSRGVARREACRMPLAADVEPQLAAARVANGDGFENSADAPLG
jgi:hypothetical protein